jgi:hypothetical protein
MTKVLERVNSQAGEAVRKEASTRIASLSRAQVRSDDRSQTVRLKRSEAETKGNENGATKKSP